MKVSTIDNPLVGPPPDEVPLSNAPLVRVIAQVRYPLIASIEKPDFIAPFQEALRPDYPALRPEQSQAMTMGPQGVIDARTSTMWRFGDASGDWRVTLAPDFFALETTNYTSRADFFRRFENALRALVEHVNPRIIDRVGVRYIDRIEGEALDNLSSLVRSEVCGALASPLRAQAKQAISQHLFDLPEERGQVMARWGLLPARATVDPAAVEPIDRPTWLLDLDAFYKAELELDVEDVVQKASAFAGRLYSVFRWAVTDDFLRRYGGKI